MLINIQEIRTEEVHSKAEDFEKKGGGLLFHVFQILENHEKFKPTDKYTCHLVVARQTLERINFDMNYLWNRSAEKANRKSLPMYQTNFEELDNSGIELGLEEFLGPFYDSDLHKPFVRGMKGNETLNSYFYFDSEEEVSNKIDMNKRVQEFILRYPDGNGDFVRAFMEPPYTIKTGKTIKERGEYFIDFVNFLF